MKIVIILILVLLTCSGVYLYSTQMSTNVKDQAVAKENAVSENIDDVMCTSTACMKKTDAPTPTDETLSTITATTNTLSSEEKPSLAKAVAQTIKKVLPKTEVAPPGATTQKYTEFVNPSGFVNSEPFALADYIGKKVILVEFITYTCINCQRTFPYLKQWYETYAKDGLIVIGIHTPEFAYERDRDNVVAAMKKEGITFPIVQDNDYQTWNAYGNHFWPHRYLIDYNGNVVFDRVGEGAYTETEAAIKLLLENKPQGV